MPNLTYPALSPSTRRRGPASGARALVHSWERTPPLWVRARNASSSTTAPSRRTSISAYTVSTGPNRARAWSTRWLPRSYRVPPTSAGSASSRQPGLGLGRKRSNRDSKRCTRPSRPSSIRRRAVRKSPSQRRFWNTDSSRPDFSANSHRSRASALVAASGLSTTVARPASRAVRASGTWVRLGEAITTRSKRSASSNSWSGLSRARAPGWSRCSWARRSGLAVTTASSRSPGVVAISGAWKAEPARP